VAPGSIFSIEQVKEDTRQVEKTLRLPVLKKFASKKSSKPFLKNSRFVV
jgi:hypothetical protein